jgi:hypothetical protein
MLAFFMLLSNYSGLKFEYGFHYAFVHLHRSEGYLEGHRKYTCNRGVWGNRTPATPL